MHITFQPNEGSVAVAAKKFELITPGDARYAALAKVAAQHNMTPEAWQKRAHALDVAADARHGVEYTMRQVPRYRSEEAA